MIRRSLLVISAALLLLPAAGCIVTRSSYEMKAKESDTLREALASMNREKRKMAEENAELAKQVASCKETEAALSSRAREMEASQKRLEEAIPGSRQTSDGNRIPREKFIDELLEREKATGKRLQELSARNEGYERDLDRMRRETVARDREVAEFREKLSILVPRTESRDASRRRDETLAGLAADLGKVSPEINVTTLGPALRIVVPEKLVVRERGGKLTDMGTAIVSKVSGAVSDLPTASLLVIAGGKSVAEAVRSVASSNGRIPKERLLSHVRDKDRTAEFLLIAQ